MNAKRFLILVCLCSVALLVSSTNAAAQRGGGHGGGPSGPPPSAGHGGGPGPGPGPSGGHGGYPSGGGGYYHGGYYPYYRPYYRPYYYSPYFYNGFYASFYFGLGFGYPYYAYPYYWGYGYPGGYYGYYGGYPCCGYPYPGYAYGAWSSARLEVKPRDAQVFIDGYFVGVVDQFDGIFQRLDIPAGQHELSIYMPGYHTYTENTLFQPGQGYHYKTELQPLPPGTPPDPKPQPSPNAQGNNGPQGYGPPGYPPPNGDPNSGVNAYPPVPYRQPPPEGADPGHAQPAPERPGAGRGTFGTLNLRVQPADAVVQIDGERWDNPDGGSRLIVQLAAGPHRIEVRKDGFRPYSTTIQIHPGEPQSINVVLPQQDQQ